MSIISLKLPEFDTDLVQIPLNLGIPSILGTLTSGQTVQGFPGIWDNPATFMYQWLLDNSPISGAVNSTYTILPGDVGKALKVTVVASNSSGNATASSLSTVIS